MAANELMFLHVDIATEQVTPMPQPRRSAVEALAAQHAALPAPRTAGRRIAMPTREGSAPAFPRKPAPG